MPQNESLLNILINQTNQAILILNSCGRVILANGAAEELLGTSTDDLLERFQLFPTAASRTEFDILRNGQTPLKVEMSSTEADMNGEKVFVVNLRELRNNHHVFQPDATLFSVDTGEAPDDREQRELELEAVARVSSVLRRAANRQEMFPIILDELTTLLDAEGAVISIVDSITGETRIELGTGPWVELTGARMASGVGIVSQVVASSAMFICDDIRREKRAYQAILPEGRHAAAFIPLNIPIFNPFEASAGDVEQEQTIGVIWIIRRDPFNRTDVRLLNAIADIAANAMHRSELFEKTQRRLKQLDALRRIDLAITSTHDLRLTLTLLLQEVIAEQEVDAADVLLYYDHSHTFEYAAGLGFRTNAVEETRIHLGEGYAGRAVVERRAICIPEVLNSDPRFTRARLAEKEGFIGYAAVPLLIKKEYKGILEIFSRNRLVFNPDWMEFLEMLAGQAALAIENARLFSDLQFSNLELITAYEATIEGWSRALELRDRETQGHAERVTEMTMKLAREIHLSDDEMISLRRGTLLHDIGKMGIPDSILLKPGPLTTEEWENMRQHPVLARDMLSSISFLQDSLDIPYCHHEKWDGSGYPQGLKGEQIPLSARIFSVVDVWDALTSDRPYRKAWSKESAVSYIVNQAGKQFDPQVVTAFQRIMGPVGAG